MSHQIDVPEASASWDPMQEQDWENLGPVVDLEREIPWASIAGGNVAASESQPTLPLSSEISNDDYDLSWMGGTKLGSKSCAGENIEAGLENSWPCPPVQRCVKRPVTPEFAHVSDVFCVQTSYENSLSSDENSLTGEDDLPLIDDDSDSCRRTVRRDDDNMNSAMFSSTLSGFPLRDGLQCISDHNVYNNNFPSTQNDSAMFTLRLFVTAITDGQIEDTSEKISGILEQVKLL